MTEYKRLCEERTAANMPEHNSQAIYRNPYHQLTNEPDYIANQGGRPIVSSLIHNARASQKSAKVFVSGGTLA